MVLLILASSTASSLQLFLRKWELRGGGGRDGEPAGEGRNMQSAHTRLGNANKHCGFCQANYNFWPGGGPQSVWGSLKTRRN